MSRILCVLLLVMVTFCAARPELGVIRSKNRKEAAVEKQSKHLPYKGSRGKPKLPDQERWTLKRVKTLVEKSGFTEDLSKVQGSIEELLEKKNPASWTTNDLKQIIDAFKSDVDGLSKKLNDGGEDPPDDDGGGDGSNEDHTGSDEDDQANPDNDDEPLPDGEDQASSGEDDQGSGEGGEGPPDDEEPTNEEDAVKLVEAFELFCHVLDVKGFPNMKATMQKLEDLLDGEEKEGKILIEELANIIKQVGKRNKKRTKH